MLHRLVAEHDSSVAMYQRQLSPEALKVRQKGCALLLAVWGPNRTQKVNQSMHVLFTKLQRNQADETPCNRPTKKKRK